MRKVAVASAVRTPSGLFQGNLASLSEQQLAAKVIKEALHRAKVEPGTVDEVILGLAKQTSKPSNAGRHALLLARLPEKIPAYTVQRQSASSLQAVANGYWAIRCGDAGVVLAGGAESMSQIPLEIYQARYSFAGRGREIVDPILIHAQGAEPRGLPGMPAGLQIGDNCVQKYGLKEMEWISYAQTSFNKAQARTDSALVPEEVTSVTVLKGKKEELVCKDELLKEGAQFAPPADGAAMCLLIEKEKAVAMGVPVLAEILSVGIAAAAPSSGYMAAVAASRIALHRAGVQIDNLDVIELNERSAAECLAILKEWQSWGMSGVKLGDKVNPTGGTLATGNPWGATGAILLAKTIYELRRQEGRFGMVVLTAEGGQGMAMVVGNILHI